MSDPAQLLKHPAVTIPVGAAATAAAAAAGVYRACEQAPLLGPWLRRGRSELAHRGEQVIADSIKPAKELVSALATLVVELALDGIDIDKLVREQVDLIGLANEVIDGVDLSAIIRDSTGTVTAEVMADVRTQGERADDYVAGIVDRMLRRNQGLR